MRKIALERQSAQRPQTLPVHLAQLQNADSQEKFQKIRFHNQSPKSYKLQFRLKNTIS